MVRASTLIALLLFGAGLAFQCAADDAHQHGAKPKAAVASAALFGGEVRKVDKAKGELTIKHGPMPKFDMPAMTMAYRVKDKSMLERVKAGDKIRFDADGVDGAFTVTRLEKAK